MSVRPLHERKRNDIAALDAEELTLRRAIEKCIAVTVIEYEHEETANIDGKPHPMWFDAEVWLLRRDGREPFAVGLIDLMPYNPAGNQGKLLELKRKYCRENNIPLVQVQANEMTEWNIRLWAWKQERAHHYPAPTT